MSGLIKRIWGISAVLLLAAAVQAELQLVEDFTNKTEAVTIDSSHTSAPMPNGVLGGVWDTEGETSGNVTTRTEDGSMTLRVTSHSSGTLYRGGGIASLSNTIDDTETGVLFFRFEVVSGRPVQDYFGMHTMTSNQFLTGTTCRTTYLNAGFGVSSASGSATFDIIRTDNTTVLRAGLARDQWYNAWIVANNATDTFDLYINQTAAPGGALEMPAMSDMVAEGLAFGVATTNPLAGMMFIKPVQSPAFSGENVFIDDIYWDGDEGLTLFTKKARNPVPANNEAFVPIEQVLSWERPDDPNVAQIFGYDVYLDPNESNLTAALATWKSTNQPGTSFDPAPNLVNEVRYYWRVDSRIKLNDPNQTEYTEPGKVWTFTTVPMTPVIMQQPTNQVRGIKNGKPDAVFMVEAVNAASYQWRKNTSPISDGGNITGATTATLTITNVGLADEGQYSCVVSNGPSNSVTTDTVWLEYARQTGQWDFENTFDADPVIGGPTIVPVAEPNTPSFESPGKIGLAAVKFAGDWAMIPPEALPKAGTEITVSFWAKTTVAGRMVLYASTLAAPTTRLLNVHIPWSSNIVYFDISNPAETAYDRVGSSAITPVDEWIQWTFTKDAETGLMRIYRNGQQLAQAANLHRRLYGVEQFFLGKGFLTSGADACFDGLVDDLRIYNYYMDEIEAAYVYSDASGLPVCVYPTDPTLQAYDYDLNCRIGVGDLVDLANNWLYDQLVP